MTEFENLLLEVADGVARVTVNRPKVLNALNAQTVGEIHRCFDQLREREDVRGVIVTGAGEKAFVAGADIKELAELSVLEGKATASRGQSAYDAIEKLGKPVIAAVNGFALGGGLELALACTLRTASTSARLGLPEVGLGVIPGYGGTQRLARLAGPGVAREWILTGEHFSAEEAHRVGVVNRLFAPEELMEGTEKMLRGILSKGPLALRMAMQAIGRGLDVDLGSGFEIEGDLFALTIATQDMREGMQAFLEKRKPEFKGV